LRLVKSDLERCSVERDALAGELREVQSRSRLALNDTML
jgi:chromosome segregation protein